MRAPYTTGFLEGVQLFASDKHSIVDVTPSTPVQEAIVTKKMVASPSFKPPMILKRCSKSNNLIAAANLNGGRNFPVDEGRGPNEKPYKG